MQKFIACFLTAASVNLTSAQPAPDSTTPSDQSVLTRIEQAENPSAPAAASAPHKTAEVIRRSGSMVKNGKLTEVRSLWDAQVSASRGSVEWHLERAGVILRSVFWAKENGDASTATKMAREALREVEAAERKINKEDPDQAPALECVFELRGLLEENFLGDTATAKREYLKRDGVRAEIIAARQAKQEKLEDAK